MDLQTSEFLDQVMSRVRTYLDGSEHVTESMPQSSLRNISDLSIPLEGLGLQGGFWMT